MVIGDLNAAEDSYLDTNRPIEQADAKPEREATLLWALKGKGLHDCFRTRHPEVRAVSRHPQGALAATQAARRIDHIFATDELARGVATRIGIHHTAPIHTDHLPIIADFSIDCAEMAANQVPVWDRVKVEKTKILDGREQNVEGFQANLTEQLIKVQYSKEDDEDLKYDKVMKAAKAAAEGTVTKTAVMRYPRRVSTLKDYHAKDKVVRTWGSRLKGAANALRDGVTGKRIERCLRRAAIPDSLPESLEVIQINYNSDSPSDREGAGRFDLAEGLEAQHSAVRAYLKPKMVAARRAAIQAALKGRNELFEEEQGRGKGAWLRSVFKEHRESHELAWARRADGSLADTPESLGELVAKKFQNWFASTTPVEVRWGSWEQMLKNDTADVCNEKRDIAPGCSMSFRDLVEECYPDDAAPDPAIWDSFLDPIASEEVTKAVDNAKAHTAPGESQLSIDVVKLMSVENLEVIVDLFNSFLKKRRVPDAMNAAILRLLPKTDQGLTDLDKTRPIALMETLGKLYERVMITRLTSTIEKHSLLETSQYGAVSGGGCTAPLKVLNDVMDDARVSGQELHVVALDLKKAFDTCEFWSQAMSLKAIGLPDEAVKLLVDLDAGSNSPADPREGPGATTKVILGAGRMSPAFSHGRGVRQGSVGGPIKWVIFMNFWLKWINKTMKGKGYRMAGDWKTEMIAQMFVDDSIWTCKDAASAQELIRRVELFCDFHSIIINREKSEYISMNDPGTQVRWTPPRTVEERKGQGHLGKVFERKGATGIVTSKLESGETDGRVTKYLGVLFEARKGWKAQTRALQEKHGKLIANLKFARISVEQAVYAINTKIIPAMEYPLQVAAVPRSMLKKWDRAHRKVLRRVGALPTDLPVEMYHASREGEMAGLGLISLEDRVDSVRVLTELRATEDYLESDRGDRVPSMQSKTTRAVKNARHEEYKWTLAAHTKASSKRLGAVIRTNQADRTIKAAAAADREACREAEPGGKWKVYTDGGTEQGESPKTSWAYWIHNGKGTEREIGGRLRGLQSNDLGEAMALLQALRAVHPSDDVAAYVDNLGVVNAANENVPQSPRERMKQSGRAIWNRIRAMIRFRVSQGAETTVEWVHSHVDDPDRVQLKEGCKQVCACGGSNTTQCQPEHEHHAGNEKADKVATEALKLEPNVEEKQLHPAFGDGDALLYIDGTLCQGNIAKAIKGAIDSARWGELCERAKPGGGLDDLVCLMKASSVPARKAVAAATAQVSTRFRARLWAGNLPTYEKIAMRCEGSDSYKEVYGDHIGKGECRCCEGNAVENVDHVMTACRHPEIAKARAAAEGNAGRLWGKQGESHAWNELLMMSEEELHGWRKGWLHRGIIPEDAHSVLEPLMRRKRKLQSLLNDTAIEMAKGAVEMWAARNDAKGEWEKTVGIDGKRNDMNRQGWRRGVTRKPRTARQRKPDSEVTPEYAEKRLQKETRERLVSFFGRKEGLSRAYAFNKQRKEKLAKENIAKATPGVDVREALQKQRDSPRFPKQKAKGRHLTAKAGRREAPACGECTVIECKAVATVTAMACKLRQGRCARHYEVRCVGCMTKCKCATEGHGTTRATGTGRKNIATRRKHRKEEIALGETARMRIDTIAGWKTATVVRKTRNACRRGEQNPQFQFVLSTGTESIHLGSGKLDRLRDVEWWLVEPKRDEEHDDGEGDSDSAPDDEEGSSDEENDGDDSDAEAVETRSPGLAPGPQEFNDKQTQSYSCAAHAMNNAMGRVRVNPNDFTELGYGRDGPWSDEEVQAVATKATMTAVTVQNSVVAKVSAESVRKGPWNGALILEGGQKDGRPINGGHWTAIRRQQGNQYVHVDSRGGVESMTPQGVAERLRKVGTGDGVVMLVWYNKVNAKAFLKDDRKSPQGEEPAGKRTKATPPRRRRGSEEPERRGTRGLGRGVGKRKPRPDDR